jgi:hypothetical protein
VKLFTICYYLEYAFIIILKIKNVLVRFRSYFAKLASESIESAVSGNIIKYGLFYNFFFVTTFHRNLLVPKTNIMVNKI